MKFFIRLFLLIIITNNLYAQLIDLTMDWSGENSNLLVGSTKQITWQSNLVENIKIEYTTDSEKSWLLIEDNYPASNGFYNWVVPNNPSIFCKIKISDKSNESIFSIYPIIEVLPEFDTKWIHHFTIYGNNEWTKISTPTLENLLSINFNDNKNGIAYGNNILLVSNDAGSSWQTKSHFTSKSICFIDENIGWKIAKISEDSDSSVIQKTEDGGFTWQTQITLETKFSEVVPFPTTTSISKIKFNNSNNGWFVYNYQEDGGSNYNLNFSTFYKTNDGGNTWSAFNENSGYKIIDYNFIDEKTGWAIAEESVGDNCGGSGYCPKSSFNIQTSDSGKTWRKLEINIPNKKLAEFSLSSYFVNPNKGWLSLGSISFDFATPNYYLGIINSDSIKIIAYNFADKQISNIYFINEKVGWIIAYPSQYNILDSTISICGTIDGGLTWNVQYTNSLYNSPKINDFFSFDGKTCWAVGDSGTILMYNDEITDVRNIDKKIISNFTLFQNYPNPFNPITKIKYAIPQNENGEKTNVKIIVYDVLGKEVATLVNENKSPGIYEANFDASNFAAGVYYYQLKTGDFIQTKKMVLLK